MEEKFDDKEEDNKMEEDDYKEEDDKVEDNNDKVEEEFDNKEEDDDKDPWRTFGFLMHFLQRVDVLRVPSFKCQVSRMSGTSSKTPLSSISRLDP